MGGGTIAHWGIVVCSLRSVLVGATRCLNCCGCYSIVSGWWSVMGRQRSSEQRLGKSSADCWLMYALFGMGEWLSPPLKKNIILTSVFLWIEQSDAHSQVISVASSWTLNDQPVLVITPVKSGHWHCLEKSIQAECSFHHLDYSPSNVLWSPERWALILVVAQGVDIHLAPLYLSQMVSHWSSHWPSPEQAVNLPTDWLSPLKVGIRVKLIVWELLHGYLDGLR